MAEFETFNTNMPTYIIWPKAVALLAADDYSSNRLLNIHAFFSCTSIRADNRSTVG